jgi:hypothetical protein
VEAEPFLTKVQGVLRDIVEGQIVKRSKHELMWETRDVTLEFIEVLTQAGYRQMLVENVRVQPGERVPAFFIESGTAYFGWVFWEKFSQLKLRKLFGSVVRNAKGDWAVQISEKRRSVIYANPDLKAEMDIDNPSGF